MRARRAGSRRRRRWFCSRLFLWPAHRPIRRGRRETWLGARSPADHFPGCASVLCGPKQTFSVGSKPIGADVVVYDSRGEKIREDKTPCVLTLAREKPDTDRANYVVVIKKQGFASAQIPITSEVNKAFFLNIFSAGIGFFVDPATGAMWTL